jgi:hypothetical protein
MVNEGIVKKLVEKLNRHSVRRRGSERARFSGGRFDRRFRIRLQGNRSRKIAPKSARKDFKYSSSATSLLRNLRDFEGPIPW